MATAAEVSNKITIKADKDTLGSFTALKLGGQPEAYYNLGVTINKFQTPTLTKVVKTEEFRLLP